MCEVNIRNFKYIYPELKKRLQESKFLSFDLEFSALYPLPEQSPSLFDSPAERYSKLKKNLGMVIPLQVGLTAFTFDPKKNSYNGKVYTFYVQPACFQGINRAFFLHTSTLNFLKLYNFDFNKFAFDGIPYMNRDQVQDLKKMFSKDEISETNVSSTTELENIVERISDKIKAWYEKANNGDKLLLPEIFTNRYCDIEIRFFLHKIFRNKFSCIWTSIEDEVFIVQKVSKQEREALHRTSSLENDTIDELIGFTNVFRLITELNKPIVGHNILQDLLLMVQNFETDLPDLYSDFKKLIVKLLPVVFDTKRIGYELKNLLPKEQRWNSRSLETVFDYFKNGPGRLLAFNNPAIEMESDQNNYGMFHDAGWDSFCAGYVFIRLAHLNLFQKYPTSKTFVSSEHIGGLMQFKNCVNIIRASIPHIKLDGPDPISIRPPYLVIESLKNTPINLRKVLSLLNSNGCVEIRPIPYRKTIALVAVDNYTNAKKILKDFHTNREYRICQYSLLKHSLVAKFLIISGLTISGTAILWFTKDLIRK